MPIAIAHGEGRAEFSAAQDLNRLREQGQVAFNYVDAQHQITERYPCNPNGASQGLAGLTAADGRVLLMMPHPERVFRSCQNVVADPEWGDLDHGCACLITRAKRYSAVGGQGDRRLNSRS